MGTICIPKSKFFPLRSHVGRASSSLKNKEVKTVTPLCEMEKHGGVSNTKSDCQLFDRHVFCSRITAVTLHRRSVLELLTHNI